MASAKSIANAVSRAVATLGPMARTSYFRVTTLAGGDDLIGRGNAVSYNDTLFVPQPIYVQLGHRQAMFLSTATLQLVADDYKFTFPVTQVSKSWFEEPDATIVLSDTNGVEGFRILYVDSADYAGADVAISVFVRSTGSTYPISVNGGDYGDAFFLENAVDILLLEDGSSALLQEVQG